MMINSGSLGANQIVRLSNVKDMFNNPHKEHIIGHTIKLCDSDCAVSFSFSAYSKKIILIVKPTSTFTSAFTSAFASAFPSLFGGFQHTPYEIVNLNVSIRNFDENEASKNAYSKLEVTIGSGPIPVPNLWTFESSILTNVKDSQRTYVQNHVSDNKATFLFDADCAYPKDNKPTSMEPISIEPVEVPAVGSFFTINLLGLEKQSPRKVSVILSFCDTTFDFSFYFFKKEDNLRLNVLPYKRPGDDRLAKILTKLNVYIKDFDGENENEHDFYSILNLAQLTPLSIYETEILTYKEMMSSSGRFPKKPFLKKYMTFAGFSTFLVEANCDKW